jgi:hypothetical protein
MQAEHKIHWFRRTNLPWLRVVECPDMPELHIHSFAWSEVLGATFDRQGKVRRAFILSHRRPGDGQGAVTPDEYNSIPVCARTIQHNFVGDPPDLTKKADARTMATEARRHIEEVRHWESWEKAHKPPAKSFLRRILGK